MTSEQPSKIISIENEEFWLTNVSATFHGRDIMAPVAARLSLGLDPDDLGTPAEQLVELAWPEVQQVANRIDGEPKQRAFTFDIGGRQTLDRSGRLRLLFMGGRSLQAARATNSQPDWIAYLGVQVNFRGRL